MIPAWWPAAPSLLHLLCLGARAATPQPRLFRVRPVGHVVQPQPVPEVCGDQGRGVSLGGQPGLLLHVGPSRPLWFSPKAGALHLGIFRQDLEKI